MSLLPRGYRITIIYSAVMATACAITLALEHLR